MFVTKRKYNELNFKLENTTTYYENLLQSKAKMHSEHEKEKRDMEEELGDLRDQLKASDLKLEFLEGKMESVRQLLGCYDNELPLSE